MAVKEYRCESCHALFFKSRGFEGHIEVKCPRCKFVNTFTESARTTDVPLLDFNGSVLTATEQQFPERRDRLSRIAN